MSAPLTSQPGVTTGPGTSVSTPQSRSDASQRLQLADSELDRVRGAARGWSAGLVGLVALVGTVTVVKGQDTLVDLAPGTRRLVVVLLAVALVSAVVGVLSGLRAGYGLPSRASAAAGDGRLRRLRAANAVPRDLYVAIGATLATLALLATAVGVTWFAERMPAAYLSVTYGRTAARATACGELLAGRPLRLRTADGTERIPVAKVRDMRVVDRCP